MRQPVDVDYRGEMRESALLVSGLRSPLSTEESSSIALPMPDSPDWDLFEAHGARQVYRTARTIAVAIVVIVCLIWPLDLALVERSAREQAIFTAWRLSLIATFGAMLAALALVPAARRHPVAVSAPFSVVGFMALGWFLGSMGGFERPYFAMASTAVMGPIVAQRGLLTRVAFTAAIALALCVGFLGLHPAHLSSAMRSEAMLHLLVVTIVGVLIGHWVYVGFCQRFFQGLAIERAGAELRSLNEELGRRVYSQTADLRRLAEHLQSVQEDERAQLSRELHDELGQRLSAMRYMVAGMRARGRSSSAALDELDAMVAGSLEATRSIVRDLRPPLLEQLGLSAAVEWLARRQSATSGLRCELELGELPDVSPALAVTTYRVLQESLTNVVRHAKASRARVQLVARDASLSLEVVDDGVGFGSGSAVGPLEGNGILGMRERARALGGALTIENRPEGGARVHLSLPLEAAAEETRS